MARLWQAPQLLLAILVALMVLTYQERRKTFLSVKEVPASEPFVTATMEYVTNDFNKKSDDKYNFRIVRILRVQKQVSAGPSPSHASPKGTVQRGCPYK